MVRTTFNNTGAAAAAGEIGIVAVVQNAVNVGYTITGYDKDATQGPNNDGIVITLSSGQ